MDPQPPSSSLPALRNLAAHSLAAVAATLINLRALYWPASLQQTSVRSSKAHTGEQHVPDSGYASAEEEDEEEEGKEEERMEVLRTDALERAFAVRWLTSFIARSEEWIYATPSFSAEHDLEKERENRARIVEEAASLLALCADTHADGALARHFSFAAQGGEEVVVELKDETYDHDHESVGLQTWGSACVLAGRLCADPGAFGLTGRVRVLELGAGTGLLSMVVAKLGARDPDLQLGVVATDFHAAVLQNLHENVTRNFSADAVKVEELDWANPPLLDETDKYDVILAADVIYDKRHGGWIKNCAERILKRGKGAVMWMIVPRRPTRGGEVAGVDGVFAGIGVDELKILQVEELVRSNGVGRADEDGYRLFRIGWA